MTQYRAYDPAVCVWGTSMLGCIAGLEKAGLPPGEALEHLREGGIASLEPEGWYPQQPYLDMLRQVEQDHGEGALRAMARQVPDTSKFPPGIHTLVQALQTLDLAYQMNHRGGAIGHYACLPLGPRDVELICQTPYGCAFDLGILDALIQAFAEPGTRPILTHQPGSGCRREGDVACTYRITW
jgi:hypothetical protein